MNSAAIKTLEQAGYRVPENPRFLGDGCYARTYELDAHRVCKITRDHTDARTAAWVSRAQRTGGYRNLARIDKVWRLSEYDPCYGERLYLIVAERLRPVPYDLFDKWHLPKFTSYLADDARNLVAAADRWALGVAQPPTVYNYETRGYTPRKVSVWGVAALNLKGITDDLSALGIDEFNDFHYENVMYRPGDRVVLSDFGSAKSPPAEIEAGC